MLHCLNRATLFKQGCCLSCPGQRVPNEPLKKYDNAKSPNIQVQVPYIEIKTQLGYIAETVFSG